MSKILVQTTTSDPAEEWSVSRFGELVDVLRSEAHEVTARNREPLSDGSDPILSDLPELDYDQLWLIAGDRANGLSPADVRGILWFRERGGGVLTARANDNLGASLLNLGVLGAVNHFQSYNRERGPRIVRHSGDRGNSQRIVPLEPVHEVLRTQNSPSGFIEYFPAHPYEGAISVPRDIPYARAIAASMSGHDGRSFNLAIAVENEPSSQGGACGRAIAVSTFYHFADPDWTLAQDRQRLDVFKDYVRNIARWLAPASA